jgi:hypothetical protein
VHRERHEGSEAKTALCVQSCFGSLRARRLCGLDSDLQLESSSSLSAEEWTQEEIPVSEFRTVLTQVRESMRGTAVVYQAEAHVSYVAGGRHYSPWLPILQPSGSKQFLQLEIINLKKKPCRVHWDQEQPDHAFLTCDGAIQLP